jgi:hypothetical protein
VEKVPNCYRPGLLRGVYLLSKSPFSKRDPQRNTRLVWDETIRIMFDLFENVWGDKPEVVLDHCLDITLPVGQVWTLLHTLPDASVRLPFLSSALQVVIILLFLFILVLQLDVGFGRRVTWTSDLIIPPGHQMTFKDALHIVAQQLFLKITLPNWAMNLTAHTRKVNLAFNELKVPCFSRYLL